VAAGIVARDRAALVGFPKTDDLVNGRWSAGAVRRELNLDPSLETVLYAPTFAPASSLHRAGEAIVEQLLGTGRNVIVKLHDRSMVPHPKYTANIDWPARLERFTGRAGYAFATGAHAGPYLAAADLMITDHSTIGFEFALLDRPLVVFDAPDLLEEARINPDKWQALRGMSDIARTPGELPLVVARALADPGRHAAARATTSRSLFAHAGHATQRALAVVYELLELPAREQLPGVREVRHQVHEVRS
jgi:CDP-glycerol glycerophosphotransferase